MGALNSMSTENEQLDECTDDELCDYVTRNILDNLDVRNKAWHEAHDRGLRIDFIGRAVDHADAFVPIKKTCVICTGSRELPDGRRCKHLPVGDSDAYNYVCTEFTLDARLKSKVVWRDKQ